MQVGWSDQRGRRKMASQSEQTLGEDIRAKLGLGDAAARRMTSGEPLEGTKDVIFDIPVHGGSGSGFDKETTFGVTMSGYGVITSPSNGTWRVLAKENGQVFLDQSNVRPGDHVPFKTGTGLTTTFEVDAWWSEHSDTSLKVQLHVTY
jgi:hypothetical protein